MNQSSIFEASPPSHSTSAANFGDDVDFLTKHTEMVILSDREGSAKVAIAPAWQGRVMTSTANGAEGLSFGWINRSLIASGEFQSHVNVFGGEDRFWLGPEGGQFSIFFAPGAKFELDDWFTPAALDTMPFQLTSRTNDTAGFAANFYLSNYSGTRFDVKVEREVRLLDQHAGWRELGIPVASGCHMVAYETHNRLINVGKLQWRRETGLLSVWILGMFKPSATTTIIVPIKPGPESELGPRVTSDYFGDVPPERLVVREDAVFFSGDGRFRSKIGVSPRRSKGVLGSYDSANGVLTIMRFSQPACVTDYVNSLWKLQDNPYDGDAINSYNDGPPEPGAKPLGPFYELESSSPAVALEPGQDHTHIHCTIHLTGPEAALAAVAEATLGVSLTRIRSELGGASS
jgi:hypothetical protein